MIDYIRISTTEPSNYSLEYQKKGLLLIEQSSVNLGETPIRSGIGS